MVGTIRLSIIFCSLLVIPAGAIACIQPAWTFESLRDAANAVVIAEPISTGTSGGIVPTERKWTNSDGSQTPILGTAVRTRFKVLTVFKGSVGEEFTLTLYKEFPTKTPNGQLIPTDICPFPYREFHPTAHEHYLIFLESVAGGGFASLDGQRSSFTAIIKLDGGPFDIPPP